MDCCVHSDAVKPLDEVEDDAEVVLVVIAHDSPTGPVAAGVPRTV
jgi:hypothetical protein